MNINCLAILVACHNNLDVLTQSIPSVYSDNYMVVVFDDGSTDGTEVWLKENYPKIHYMKSDGENWWSGSIAKGIDYCISRGIDYIVSLNADVIITPEIVSRLYKVSTQTNDSIVASTVVSVNDPDIIVWAGSMFCKIHSLFPVYASRYVVKPGLPIASMPDKMYEVDEVHGRGVLIPASVINKIGNLDYKVFPHYGGDTDFSLRAKKHGVKMFVDPFCIAKVFSENTSLNKIERLSFIGKLISINNYLFKRKNGEALYVWWNLYKKHLSLSYFVQSYLFVIILNVYRKIVR